MSTVERPPAPLLTQEPERPARERFMKAFAEGDLGVLRVLMMLALIWFIFQVQEPRFLSSGNLTNLLLQITSIGLISVGIVLVLLLGEIDLSVGAVSGLAAGVMAVLTVRHGWAPVPAIGAALTVGAAIGLFNGLMVTKFGIPSFVVTLAGQLAWAGGLLYVLGSTGDLAALKTATGEIVWKKNLVKDFGGTARTATIPNTGGYSWTELTIGNVNVTNGQCTVGFYSNTPTNQWIHFDDVELLNQ